MGAIPGMIQDLLRLDSMRVYWTTLIILQQIFDSSRVADFSYPTPCPWCILR